VIEIGISPIAYIVAGHTVGAEPGGGVVRIRRLLVVLQMATRTVRRQCREHTAGVALRTILDVVPLGQGERAGMLEVGISPIAGVMACHAIHIESRRGVVRVGGLLVVLRMAACTVHGQRGKHTAIVALATILNVVPVRQGERAGMLEVRTHPGAGIVAAHAVHTEP